MALPLPEKKFVFGIAFVGILFLFFFLFSSFFSLEYMESQRIHLIEFYALHPVLVPGLYISASAVLIGLALPVTGVLALLGGALFGFFTGWIMSSIAGTIGSIIVYLWSRYLFQDWLQERFQRQLSQVNKGIEADGVYYLFSIRLIAVFPFFLVNLLCGIAHISLSSYVVATFLGQTIVVALWVYAGSRISNLVFVGD
ncbi:VTT domain-containing protein, partial [Halioglobus sp.]|nr:VTT domain-containing protein [Halioglobus sp.]